MYVAGTVGTVLIREVSLRISEVVLYTSLLYVVGTVGTVLIREIA